MSSDSAPTKPPRVGDPGLSIHKGFTVPIGCANGEGVDQYGIGYSFFGIAAPEVNYFQDQDDFTIMRTGLYLDRIDHNDASPATSLAYDVDGSIFYFGDRTPTYLAANMGYRLQGDLGSRGHHPNDEDEYYLRGKLGLEAGFAFRHANPGEFDSIGIFGEGIAQSRSPSSEHDLCYVGARYRHFQHGIVGEAEYGHYIDTDRDRRFALSIEIPVFRFAHIRGSAGQDDQSSVNPDKTEFKAEVIFDVPAIFGGKAY